MIKKVIEFMNRRLLAVVALCAAVAGAFSFILAGLARADEWTGFSISTGTAAGGIADPANVRADILTTGGVLLGIALVIYCFRRVKGMVARALTVGLVSSALLMGAKVQGYCSMFSLSGEDTSTLVADLTSAGGVLLGIALVVFAFRRVKGMLSR